jgi:hypothetical protein
LRFSRDKEKPDIEIRVAEAETDLTISYTDDYTPPE